MHALISLSSCYVMLRYKHMMQVEDLLSQAEEDAEERAMMMQELERLRQGLR